MHTPNLNLHLFKDVCVVSSVIGPYIRNAPFHLKLRNFSNDIISYAKVNR